MLALQPPSGPPGDLAGFPERVGRYELLLPIASGGMATVYLARLMGPGGFERHVALKLTHAHLRQDPAFALEVLDEAHLSARIRHPNVVSMLEVGDDPLGVFLVMEYIEGDTLAGLVALGGPLPPRIGARILLDALAGLHAAHELTDVNGAPLELVHRDFSPQNLLVGVDGITRLADFGVAKAATRLGHTTTGAVKGKVAYMAPEQARGLALDRRCDVWAAGVVAWETVAGRLLYPRDENGLATLLKVVSEEPARLGRVAKGVSPALEEAVACALESRLEARHRTAADFRAALAAAFREGPGIAETDDVASYAAALLATPLAERRGRARRVVALREGSRRAAAPVRSEGPAPGSVTEVIPPASAVEVRLPLPAGSPRRAARPLAVLGLALAVAAGAASVAVRPSARASVVAQASSADLVPPGARSAADEASQPVEPAEPRALPGSTGDAKSAPPPQPPARRKAPGPSLLPSPYEKR